MLRPATIVLLGVATVQIIVSLVLLRKTTRCIDDCQEHANNSIGPPDRRIEAQFPIAEASAAVSPSIEDANLVLPEHVQRISTNIDNSPTGTDPPVCERTITTDEKLWVAIPAWNNSRLLQSSMESVLLQEDIGYSKIEVVVFEDYSRDMLTEEIKQYFLSFGQKVEFSFIKAATRSHNRRQQPTKGGSALSKWSLFQYIRDHALPNEYILILDGDDTLADNTVVNYLFHQLHRYKPWFAWGRHNGKYSEQCRDIDRSSLSEDQSSFEFREDVGSFCHPRVFQAHLLRDLEVADFQRDNGGWLQKVTDLPFIIKFMELAGPERVHFLGEKAMYNYTYPNQDGLEVFTQQTIKSHKTTRRAPLSTAQFELHVVACVYKRRNTETFLNSLLASRLPPRVYLNIHICNNDKSRQAQLEKLATKLKPSPERRSITIHKMDYNMGGYARFVLSRRLTETRNIDYIIMLDDDQYVRPLSLSRIFKSREPMTYKSWYGKNWKEDETSYWKPRDQLPTDPNLRGRVQQDIDTWQYGGTGMSIIDASIFRTKELFELEYEYRFVEDVWLSYIVHQLPGWRIGRLNIKFDSPGTQFSVKTGQFMGLRNKKDRLFAELGFLRCHMRDVANSLLPSN